MALSKNSIVDKVEIFDTGEGWSIVQVRRADIISEDGVEVSRGHHRWAINPTDDWSGESPEVQAVCNIAHTADKIAAYNARMSATPEDDS